MKLCITLALIIAPICTSYPPHASRSSQTPDPKWIEAYSAEIPESLTKPNPDVGAAGTSAAAFWLGGHRAGCMIDRLDRKGVCVFVAATLPEEFAAEQRDDVRVEFELTTGSVVTVKHDAAVASLLSSFPAPASVSTKDLKRFRVIYQGDAPWAKQL